MHRWLRLLLASCAISGLFESALVADEPARPNIVFLISDDHAWTDYGCMGHPHIETPISPRSCPANRNFSKR
jgi:hypothetical protein